MPNQAALLDAQLSARLQTQAKRLAIFLIKRRARAYSERPIALETVSRGLSCAAPEAMIAIAKALLARERRSPRRWMGFGGEPPGLNARAVLLLGRSYRRAADLQRRAQTLCPGLSPDAQPSMALTPRR